MLNIIDKIYESKFDTSNLIIWDNIEFNENNKYDESKIKEIIKDKLFIIEKNIIITLVSAFEDKYNKDLENYEINLKKAAELSSSKYKRFLKLKNKKEKEDWILNKINSIKKDSEDNKRWANIFNPKEPLDSKRKGNIKNPIIWSPNKKDITKINTSKFFICIFNNLYHRNEYYAINWDNDYTNLANKIIDKFPDNPKNCLEHLKNIYFFTYDKDLSNLKRIYISFEFDNEYEEENKLSEHIYNSNHLKNKAFYN